MTKPEVVLEAEAKRAEVGPAGMWLCKMRGHIKNGASASWSDKETMPNGGVRKWGPFCEYCGQKVEERCPCCMRLTADDLRPVVAKALVQAMLAGGACALAIEHLIRLAVSS